MSMDDVQLELVLKLKKRLSDALDENLGEDRILKVLHKLSQVPMTIDILQSTQIGRDVNALRKHNGRVKSESKTLVQTWKRLLPSDTTSDNHKLTSSAPGAYQEHFPEVAHNTPSINLTTGASGSVEPLSKPHHKHKKTRSKSKGTNIVDGFSQALLGVPGTESNFDPSNTPNEATHQPISDVSHRIAHKPKVQPESTRRSVKRTSTSSQPTNHKALVTKTRTISPLPPGARRSVSPNPLASSRSSTAHASTSLMEGPLNNDTLLVRKRKADVVGGLDAVALSKKSRTQVYSGKKSSSGPHIVTSLFDTCIKVLIDNIDVIEEVGGIPFYVLEPVLARCTATQLMRLEEFNPHFIEDSDLLWEKHCHKEFRGAKPTAGQLWRELYIGQLEAQELRLKRLTERISATEKARQEPIRKVLSTVATRKPGRKGARAPFFHGGRSVEPLESKSKSRPLMKQTMKMAQHRNHMMRFKPSQR